MKDILYCLVITDSRFSFYLQVATGQVASTGMVALSYVQKVSEKVRKLMYLSKKKFSFSIF